MSPRLRALPLVASFLALGLVALPYLGRQDARAGELAGVVVDPSGFGVPDVALFLFSEAQAQLVEETRSDARGDFVFHLAHAGTRVFAEPPEGSGWIATWGPSSSRGPAPLAFVLRRAHPLGVRVRDDLGCPVAGAEVRVYERRSEAALVALARTDEEGRARLEAPPESHVAVVAPEAPHLMRWRFDLGPAPEGLELDFVLPPARRLEGRVQDADGPLANVVLVSWENGMPSGWNGFAISDAEGRFELPATRAPTTIRALDPSARHLTARFEVGSSADEPLTLELTPGNPQRVRSVHRGEPLATRVWSWSPEERTWSWGVLTGPDGRARVPVGARFGVHARPLDPSFPALEAWDVHYGGETLLLEAAPDP